MHALFIHGMGRSPLSAMPLLARLKTGGLTTSTFGYATVFHGFDVITQRLAVRIAEIAAQGEAQLWQLYDSLTPQTLLLRGANSDLLSPATAQAMTQRGPKAQLVEFAGVGHAPTLIAPDQVDTVTSFLLG